MSTDDGWVRYFDATRDKPPRPLLREALKHVSARSAALDLGSGALNDARFLLGEGFSRVVAVDIELVAAGIADNFPKDRFEYVQSRFEDYAFPYAAFDVVNAQLSLPFTHPDAFPRVIAGALASLRQGGIFAGQLFGDRHQWSDDPEMTFHSLVAARAVFDSMELILFDEVDDSAAQLAAGGTARMHLFPVIARRPA